MLRAPHSSPICLSVLDRRYGQGDVVVLTGFRRFEQRLVSCDVPRAAQPVPYSSPVAYFVLVVRVHGPGIEHEGLAIPQVGCRVLVPEISVNQAGLD